MPHTPSPRPHLLRYVASRGNPLLCIERAYGATNLKSNASVLTERRGAETTFHNDRTLCVHISLPAVSHVTRKPRLRHVAALAAFSILLIGCEAMVNEVRVLPGPTPLKPVFVLTDSTGHGPAGTIYGLSIVACGTETVLWQIAASGSNTAPSRIEYGVVPPGFVVNAGPASLRPGCYDVFVTDGRRARFRVDGFGHVIPDSRRDTVRR
jgi:hypothetical protein